MLILSSVNRLHVFYFYYASHRCRIVHAWWPTMFLFTSYLFDNGWNSTSRKFLISMQEILLTVSSVHSPPRSSNANIHICCASIFDRFLYYVAGQHMSTSCKNYSMRCWEDEKHVQSRDGVSQSEWRDEFASGNRPCNDSNAFSRPSEPYMVYVDPADLLVSDLSHSSIYM